MTVIENEPDLDSLAENYSRHYGAEAYRRIGEDINKAIGSQDWDKAYLLQKTQWRLRKLERLRQVAASLRMARRDRPAQFTYA